jgi:DNA-binding NarL/FixJ family response regulator
MNGIEFLGIIKADAGLKKIPVVVLTTSSEERDVVESFRLSVAGYIIKPVDYRNFVDAVRTINLYWTLSEIPDEKAEDTDAQCQALAAGGRQS